MKGFLYAAAALVLLSIPAFASGKTQRQKVTFPNPITVGSTQFAQGECNVTWEESGDTVQLTLHQRNKNISTTVPATVVKGEHPDSSLVMTQVGDGHVLNSIQFKHFALVLGSQEVASESAPKTNQ